MNLVLLSLSDFIPSTTMVLLKGRRQAHVRDIHRARAGDSLVVGLEGGRIGEGRIVRMTDTELAMEVAFTSDPPPKIPVILCVAMMRPIVFRRVLQAAAAMGVEEVHVFHSCRVEKSFWQSTALSPEEIREQLVLGLEQAKDTVLPGVSLHRQFKPFVQDKLAKILDGRQGIVADPSGGSFIPGGGPKVLFIGPEGGFVPYELDQFRAAGCRALSFGPRILRVETAVTALLARLS